jgi:hypothetical protein
MIGINFLPVCRRIGDREIHLRQIQPGPHSRLREMVAEMPVASAPEDQPRHLRRELAGVNQASNFARRKRQALSQNLFGMLAVSGGGTPCMELKLRHRRKRTSAGGQHCCERGVGSAFS